MAFHAQPGIQEPQVHKPLVARPVTSAGKATRPQSVVVMRQPKIEPTLTLGKEDILPTINVVPPSCPQDTSSVPKLLRPSSPTSTAATSLPTSPRGAVSWPGSPFEHDESAKKILPKISVDLMQELTPAEEDQEDEELRAKLQDSLDGMLGTCMRLCNGVATGAEEAAKLDSMEESSEPPTTASEPSETSPDLQEVPMMAPAKDSEAADWPSPRAASSTEEMTIKPPSSPTRRLREALERGKALATEVLDLPVPSKPELGTVFFDDKMMFFDRQPFEQRQKELELAALRSELRSALEREDALRRLRANDLASSDGEVLELRSRVRIRDEIVKAKSNEIASLRLEIQHMQQRSEEQRTTSAEERLKALEELNMGLQLELEDMKRCAASREARKEYPRYQRRSQLALDFIPWRPSSARPISARRPL
mmetsp:Transcript_63031/g.111987  ORF Transcript_63031/g.111987 Transcript_63031/m.111987 type:complete len:424 (+) Transcript_63031:54-1325(+)